MDNQNYKDFAVDLAYQAWEIMKKYFEIGIKTEWKKDNTPVTVADKEINQLVIEKVKEKFPTHGVLGEEASDLSGSGECLWVCDPIDGTIPYSHGIPTSMFSLALVKNGKLIIGVAYDPFMDRMFSAEKAGGAFMNNLPIRVNCDKKASRLVVALEWWNTAPNKLTRLFENLNEKDYIVTIPVSIVYASMMVACGEFCGAIFAGKTAHDIAAVKVIVEEAEGIVTDLDGNEQLYDGDIKGAVISSGEYHKNLLDLVKQSYIQ